jgi:hypothetical protein
MASKIEQLLEALLNGETVDIVPQSRNEELLLALLNGETVDMVPQSRNEALLAAICAKFAGGGSSADVRYVTFMSDDGTTEYGKKAVAVGDDCADPIARGVFDTPTKEPDAQYTYTFYGWATEPNGGVDDNWNKAIIEDKTVYANFASVAIEEDEWSKVRKAVSNGTYKDVYKVGDTIPLDLGSEGVVNMQIAAFDADNLADGSGKAPITWISKELLKTKLRMNPILSNTTGDDGSTIYTEGTGAIGGWEKSELRTYLKNTIKPLIPGSALIAIKEVTKTQAAYDTNGAKITQTANDDVWIASIDEVYGGSSLYVELFKNDNTNRQKSIVGTTTPTAWWLRSAKGTSEFNFVYANGSTSENSNNNAISAVGVTLCFCT